MRSTRRRCGRGDATTASRVSGPTTDPNYYAAFVVDPDGYRIEAYCGEKS